MSLLAHAGLLGLPGGRDRASSHAESDERTAPEDPGAEFFELVELADEVPEEPPDAKTELVSDRSARGATPDESERGESPLPQLMGDVPAFDLPRGGADLPRVAGLEARSEVDETADGEGARAEKQRSAAERLALPSRDRGGLGLAAPNIPFPSRLGLGADSFNTLEWDFAPYALEMKRRIAERWYPPVAFGLYGGVTVLRFRIERDGTLVGPELVSGAEHSSLDTAAINAVALAAPFRALPTDFPEEHLEVTFSFHYLLGPRARISEPGGAR